MPEKLDQQKKENILQIARELFFRFGYHKTSMDDIAQQVGLAKPTLYYYYPNKEAIFDEIVIREASAFLNKVEQAIPENLAADQKIVAFFRNIYDQLQLLSVEMEGVPDIICKSSPHGQPVIQKISELFQQKIRPILQAGLEDGTLELSNTEVTASTIGLMTKFLNLEWMLRTPKTERDEIIETMLHIILNGLRRRTE